MTLEEKQKEIVEDFAIYDDWMEKYEYIIDLGKDLPLINEKYKTDEYIIEFRGSTGNSAGYLYTFQATAPYIQKINLTTDTTALNQIGNIYINGVLQSGSSDINFLPNVWYHIVVSVANGSVAQQIWDKGLRFGNRFDGTTGGNGNYQDQIRTFNRALSGAEVLTLYNEIG